MRPTQFQCRPAAWIARAGHELTKGLGIGRVARMTGQTGTVHSANRPSDRGPDDCDASVDPRKAATNFCIAELVRHVPRDIQLPDLYIESGDTWSANEDFGS